MNRYIMYQMPCAMCSATVSLLILQWPLQDDTTIIPVKLDSNLGHPTSRSKYLWAILSKRWLPPVSREKYMVWLDWHPNLIGYRVNYERNLSGHINKSKPIIQDFSMIQEATEHHFNQGNDKLKGSNNRRIVRHTAKRKDLGVDKEFGNKYIGADQYTLLSQHCIFDGKEGREYTGKIRRSGLVLY